MEFLTFLSIWITGWLITTLMIILVEPPDHDDTPAVVFIPLAFWPLIAPYLLPVYLFSYIIYLRKRYL